MPLHILYIQIHTNRKTGGGGNVENGIKKYTIPKEFKKANCLRGDADNVDPALARPISQYRATIPHFVQLWVERQRVVLSQKCIKMHKNANIGFICILMYATVQHYRPTGSSFHSFLYLSLSLLGWVGLVLLWCFLENFPEEGRCEG